MKYPFSAYVTILICGLLVACGQASQAAPIATLLPTNTAIPSQTADPQFEALPTLDINALPTFSLVTPNSSIPSPTPNPKIPTLLPTIDPNLLPDLLKKSISIQTLTSVNGHNLQRITGWDYGFSCTGYQWLDSKHLLLYPRTGQAMKSFMDGNRRENLGSEPIIVNLTNGIFWLLPPSNTFSTDSICNSVYWSRELGMIINQENDGSTSDPAKDAVFTYSFDGQNITQYNGKISGISPSGEKILVNDKTIIELRNNKVTDLNWHIGNDPAIPPNFFIHSDPTLPINLYWSSDETRLYRCCFYFADMKTGKSYNFNWNDLHGAEGESLPTPVLPHTHGQWVRNGDFFLVEWNYFSDMSADYIPMFSPVELRYYDLVAMVGIPKSRAYISAATFYVSPDGTHLWIDGFGYDGRYYDFLINLTTFATATYDKSVEDFEWSPDSKFAWLTISDVPQTTSKMYILSEAQNTLNVFPTEPTTTPVWRPSDHISAYLTKKNQTLDLLDAQDLSIKELKLPSTFDDLIWSPDGNHLALVAIDGSLWQADFPKFDNFEQLTPALPNVTQVNWSPDGNSIAFVSGSDVYIVGTTNK